MIPRDVIDISADACLWNAGILPVEDRYLMIGNTGDPNVKAWRFVNSALQPIGGLSTFRSSKNFDFRLFPVGASYYASFFTKHARYRAAPVVQNFGVTRDWDLRWSPTRYLLDSDIAGWPGYQKTRAEKNWMPFYDAGEIRLVYSVVPHRVVQLDLKTTQVSLIHTETWTPPWKWADHGFWGNANVVPCGDYYFAMFHSKPTRQYITGYYLFERKPPYRPVRIGREPLFAPWMSTEPRKSERIARAFDNVIFPVGATCRHGEILVSYGENDYCQRIAVFKESDLLAGTEAICQ